MLAAQSVDLLLDPVAAYEAAALTTRYAGWILTPASGCDWPPGAARGLVLPPGFGWRLPAGTAPADRGEAGSRRDAARPLFLTKCTHEQLVGLRRRQGAARAPSVAVAGAHAAPVLRRRRGEAVEREDARRLVERDRRRERHRDRPI